MRKNGLREADFLFINQPQIAKDASRGGLQRNLPGLNQSGVTSLRRNINSLNTEMRLYIAWCITHPINPKDFREIKCEKCGVYENLEFHHKKYAPEEKVFLKDVRISCNKCHRGARITSIERKRSKLRTVFIESKRYCETSHYKFEY